MKPLQGNLDFFLIRASRGPFRLKHKTEVPSHIHIPNGKLLLRSLWKVGLPLQYNPGNKLSSRDAMASMELISSSCAKIGVPLDLRQVSQGSLELLK